MPNTKDTLKHYGYPEDTPDKDVGIGLWDKSDALDRLAKLPEMLPYLTETRKSGSFSTTTRTSESLLQITGLKDNDCVVHYTYIYYTLTGTPGNFQNPRQSSS